MATVHNSPVRPSLVIPACSNIFKAVHDFEARSPDELTLKKGDEVEVLYGEEKPPFLAFAESIPNPKLSKYLVVEISDGVLILCVERLLIGSLVKGKKPASGEQGLFPKVYTIPTLSLFDTRDSVMVIEPMTFVCTEQAASAVTSTPFTPATPRRTTLVIDDQNGPSQTMGSCSSETHDAKILMENLKTAPLSVDKLASGNSIRPMSGLDQGVVLATNAVEERTTNYTNVMRSPVVEDTLSDIEEAISEISKSSQTRKNSNVINQDQHRRYNSMSLSPTMLESSIEADFNDSESEYSDHELGSQGHSLVTANDAQGTEDNTAGNDGDLDFFFSKEDIQTWTPSEVSKYLQSRHIPLATCSKFEEQEVSGAILLELEMTHLKELELGSFGKRFEVWKVIKHLTSQMNPRGTKYLSGSDVSKFTPLRFVNDIDVHRQRSRTIASISPRIKSQYDQPLVSQYSTDISKVYIGKPDTESFMKTSSIETTLDGLFEQPRSPPLSPGRGSISSIKRRSAQATALHTAISTGVAVLATSGTEHEVHKREASFDRYWSSATLGGAPRPSTATGFHEESVKYKNCPITGTSDSSFPCDSGCSSLNHPTLNEQSYFSGGELVHRERKLLEKRNGLNHVRKGSYTEEQRLRSATAHTHHCRVASSESALKTSSPSFSAAIGSYRKKEKHYRNSTSLSDLESLKPSHILLMKEAGNEANSPTAQSTQGSPIPFTPNSALFVSDCQMDSFRSNSDKRQASPTSTGPRTTSEGSFPSAPLLVDVAVLEHSQKANRSNSSKSMKKRIRGVSSGSGLRQKSKRQTTALEKGIRMITPQDAAKDADYSGWMKKRGASGVGAWKPRFFVLNGRRLSYFYSSSDVKERGLIDITSHKVLVCTEDRFIGLHAAIAAVTSPAASPKQSPSPLNQNMNSQDLCTFNSKENPRQDGLKDPKEKLNKEKEERERGWFTFKLVPPVPGAAKGVTFTPPRLHYFATDTREEGKKWMAAMMKATIDRDETKPVITSYNAKTISLAKARELRTRPPELINTTDTRINESAGLAIRGIDLATDDRHLADSDDNNEDLNSIDIENNLLHEQNGVPIMQHDESNETDQPISINDSADSFKGPSEDRFCRDTTTSNS